MFLVLFATGVRGRSDLSAVRATIDGREIPVLFAGDQGFFLARIFNLMFDIPTFQRS